MRKTISSLCFAAILISISMVTGCSHGPVIVPPAENEDVRGPAEEKAYEDAMKEAYGKGN